MMHQTSFDIIHAAAAQRNALYVIRTIAVYSKVSQIEAIRRSV